MDRGIDLSNHDVREVLAADYNHVRPLATGVTHRGGGGDNLTEVATQKRTASLFSSFGGPSRSTGVPDSHHGDQQREAGQQDREDAHRRAVGERRGSSALLSDSWGVWGRGAGVAPRTRADPVICSEWPTGRAPVSASRWPGWGLGSDGDGLFDGWTHHLSGSACRRRWFRGLDGDASSSACSGSPRRPCRSSDVQTPAGR